MKNEHQCERQHENTNSIASAAIKSHDKYFRQWSVSSANRRRMCTASLGKCTSVNEYELINNNTLTVCMGIWYWFVTLSAAFWSYLSHECVEVWIWQFISSLLMLQTNERWAMWTRIEFHASFTHESVHNFGWLRFYGSNVLNVYSYLCKMCALSTPEIISDWCVSRLIFKFQWNFNENLSFSRQSASSLSLILSSIKC